MKLNDFFLLSPEISLVVLAGLMVLLDLVVKRKGLLPAFALIALAVPFIFSIVLWVDLDANNNNALTGFFGSLVGDKFSLFFKFLILSAAALVVLASTEYTRKFERFRAEYYALVLFSTAGMMLLASATELITIFVSLELTALPIAALAAFLRGSRSTESAMKFLILSAISSAVLLYGMVIIYGFTGSTSLEVIAARLADFNLSSG